MLKDYLKIRKVIHSINNSAQIVMCNGLIKRFHEKHSEGHDNAMKLTGFLGGVAKERFSY